MVARFNVGAWACAVVLAVSSAPALAETTLPDGTVVPRPSNVGPSPNTEQQLSDLFTMRGEAIDFVQDGFPTPDTFSPLCGFKATFVMHQADDNPGLGWYNVNPDPVSTL